MSARSEVRKKLVENASRDDLAEALRLACAMLDRDRDRRARVAVIERCPTGHYRLRLTNGSWDGIQFRPELANVWRESVRAALQASGWEEAAETVRELASSDVTCSLSDEESREEAEQCPFCLGMHGRHAADCLLVRARAWVAQYTPEGK